MIIDYDHNPRLTYDQKLQSLKESVQMALNEAGSDRTNGLTYLWGKLKETFSVIGHTHTEYYTKSEVDQLISSSTANWSDKAAASVLSDCNDATASGIYIIGSTTANRPVNVSYFGAMLVIRSTSANYLIQIAFNNESGNPLYYRKKGGSNTWGSWRTINTTALT